jgi:hypothetical protein
MREFPAIDSEVESHALQTIFFEDGESEGRACRIPKLNYLLLLSLRDPDIPGKIEKFRLELAQYPLEDLERDIGRLYAARNWRLHLIACVAVASGFATENTMDALWKCLSQGSWASPQLAATAAFVDLEFVSKASSLIADDRTYYKSIVALADILEKEFDVVLPEGSAAGANLVEALTIDSDGSGKRAVGWLTHLRGAVGPVSNSRANQRMS